jgi:phosphoglycolate phosphatase
MSLGAILFDFDGTLVDARESAWELFVETNHRFHLGIDTREEFFGLFRTNFFEAFEARCLNVPRRDEAKAHFLELLRTQYHPRLIPGIVDVIRSLSPSWTLVVLSTNTMAAIRRTLEDAGVATCFSHVFSGDVEPSKTRAIERFLNDQSYGALRQCTPSYVDEGRGHLATHNVYLVTDTSGDVAEAQKVGIGAVGVAWGMHDQASLERAGALRVALWPQELSAWFAEWAVNSEACSCEGCSTGATCCTTSARSMERRDADAASRSCERRRPSEPRPAAPRCLAGRYHRRHHAPPGRPARPSCARRSPARCGGVDRLAHLDTDGAHRVRPTSPWGVKPTQP